LKRRVIFVRPRGFARLVRPDRFTEVGDPVHEAKELVGVESVEQRPQHLVAPAVEILDCPGSLRRLLDGHDATVSPVAQALHEPALLHPIHDPRGIRHGHAEQVRQARHGLRPVILQYPERLQVRHADAVQVETPGRRAALVPSDRGGSGEDLVDQRPALG
jgi:hypothetical protein